MARFRLRRLLDVDRDEATSSGDLGGVGTA